MDSVFEITTQKAWQSSIANLQTEMSRAAFDTWVKPAWFVDFIDDTFVVGCNNSYGRDWLADRLTSTLERYLGGVMNTLSETNKNLNECLNWLMPPDDNACPVLVEEIEGISEQGSSSGGNQPAVYHLTPEGQMAYQVLTGKFSKENEYDFLISHHSSPEHTILNIQAAKILAEEGYQIRGLAQAIQLSNGETYIPDIIAADPKIGEVIFIEVERDVHKDQTTRKQKWMKLFEASNGNLYVFCDNLNCQRAIQGEINLALGGLAYNSLLTNLHGVRSGKRSEKDSSIWLSQRRGK